MSSNPDREDKCSRDILRSIFCLGFASLISQVVFMREMLVVFSGNELTIGSILSGWLLGVGSGAFASGLLTRKFDPRRTAILLLALIALYIPLQSILVRTVRWMLSVPAGEYASFSSIFTVSLVLCFPVCFCIGLYFPLVCRTVKGRAPAALVYRYEATGSALAGLLVTFVLIRYLPSSAIVICASFSAAAGTVAIISARRRAAIILLVMFLACMALSGRIDTWANVLRLRSSGVLPTGSAPESQTILSAATDTKYQNLTIVSSEEQHVMYGHGRYMFVFPDAYAYEHSIHFLMAQNPKAQKVLLLGGNPVGDIPELLKYPLAKLVYVEMDSGIGDLIQEVDPDSYRRAVNDPRLEIVTGDAPRYVSNCDESFDVVIVNASNPSTAWENRFFTTDFYKSIREILTETGFMYSSLRLSVRLQSQTAMLGASVYKSLKSTFPVVLVTAGSESSFIAGSNKSNLTLDRNILYERSKASSVKCEYFQPEYFLAYDDIDPAKVSFVKEQFTNRDVPANSIERPVAYFYNLMIWDSISKSGVGAFLSSLQAVKFRIAAGSVAVLGVLLFLAGRLFRSGRWHRIAAGCVIGSTGFTAMAVEVILIFIFQSLFGYVYARIGLIVAMFMLGLVLGAPSGSFFAARMKARNALILTETVLLIFVLIISRFLSLQNELPVYAAVIIAGWLVGVEFPLGNRLHRDAGGSVDSAAAITDATDHLGAAAGALLLGVFLIPVLGIVNSCLLLASLKFAAIMTLAGLRKIAE